MDFLTQAAQSMFETDAEEELCIPLTPTKGMPLTPSKGERAAFTEITNTINISPDKFNNSPLQALFNDPTLGTPKTKSRNFINIVNSSGSQSVGCGSAGKSLSSPMAGSEVGTPTRNGIPPSMTSSGGSGKSPLTPMTNLKLLTRIASMEESLTTSSKKVLFGKENHLSNMNTSSGLSRVGVGSGGTALRRYNSECLGQSLSKVGKVFKESTGVLRKHPTSDNYPVPSSPGNLVLEGIGRIPSVDDTSSSRPSEVSRKDKSLGLLSEKFLEQFPMEVSYLETPRRLIIDEVAAVLSTERRRVYDIINVLESLNMATRVQKNMYQWTGKLHLEETLGRLKALGEKYDIATQLQALKEDGKKDFKIPQQMKLTRIGDAEKADSRKEKSLSILCQKFLMILLVSPQPHIISLDNAIRLLVGEVGEGGERLRARGRRLYDIANVLTSLGLVRRIPAAKAFQYVGPAVDPIVNDDDKFGILQRHSLLPSRNANECKVNMSSYGDHEVTPSDVAPPVQKRGRPRKLATAFSTTTAPAPKRSRLLRTRSEDVITSQSSKMTRNPSLHDICQVAEVEREKMMKEQRSSRSHSSDWFESGCGRGQNTHSFNKSKILPNSDFRPISLAPSEVTTTSLLQRRLTKKARIPVALTFQGSEGCRSNIKENLNPHSSAHESKEPAVRNQNCSVLDNQISSGVACHYPMPVRGVMGKKVVQDVRGQAAMSETLTQGILESLSPGQQFNIKHAVCNRTLRTQPLQEKEPVIIVRGNTLGSKAYSQSRVVPVSSSLSQGTQVIKVITKTAASRQQDASTVMTVLPASQSVRAISVRPQQMIRNSSGTFQQVSEGTYTNGQRITLGSSNHRSDDRCGGVLRVGTAPEAKPSNSFVVFTVSDSPAGQRTLSKLSSAETFPVSIRQPFSVPHLSSVRVGGESVPSGMSSLTSAPLKYERNLDQQSLSGVGSHHHYRQPSSSSGSRNNLNVNNGSWQPSPDGSSTDSELEQIFGDTFNFSRPKALVHSSSSKAQGADYKS